MNLKKIGSALTAISMIASMATYVPASVSAAEANTEVTPTHVYSGALTDENCIGAKYTLNVYDDDSLNTLILEPVTADSVYSIPNAVLAAVAYEIKGTDSTAAAYDTAAEVGAAIKTIDIKGPAEIAAGTITNSSAVTKVKADCRAVINDNGTKTSVTDTDLAGLSANASDPEGEVAHTMLANQTAHNHYCKYGDYYGNTFEDHDFTIIDKTAKVEKCECGITDRDFYVAPTTGSFDDTVNDDYRSIHTFENHKCKDCGAYDLTAHDQQAELKFTVTATQHTVECKTECGYKKTAENHTWAVTDEEITTLKNPETGANIPKNSHYCSTCGYVQENPAHVYDCVYKPVKQNGGGYALEVVKAVTGETPYVCSCGEKISTHACSESTYKAANGIHYCPCGVNRGATHVWNLIINSNGETVPSIDSNNQATGLICACGEKKPLAADTNHVSHVAVYIDKTNNKHICGCGEEVDVHSYVANPETHKHVCVCGKENPNAHAYDWNARFDGTNKKIVKDNDSVSAGEGLICKDCGAIKEHKCEFTVGDTFNQVDYCACGAKTDEHTWGNDTVCDVCGAIKDHKHVAGTPNCTCTDPNCNVQVHTWKAVAGKSYHICTVCGTKSTDPSAAGIDPHTYNIDKENHQHICDCGQIDPSVNNGHTYGKTGTSVDECSTCGYTKHVPNAVPTAEKNGHVCSNCGYVYTAAENYGHQYDEDDADDKCNVANCNKLKVGHIHAFASNSGNDEKCKCGADVAHDFVLDRTNISQHVCDHKVYVTDANGNPTTSISTSCAITAATHVFSIPATGTAVTYRYCNDGCGAVNPAILSEVRAIAPKIVLANDGSNDGMVGKYKSAYLVDLNNKAQAVLAYDIYAGGFDADNEILVAKTASEKAAFESALSAFNTAYADRTNNTAASYVKGVLANGMTSDMGSIADGEGEFNATQYDVPGKTVKIKAVPAAGYQFVGWYTSATPSATDQPVSTDAIFSVTVPNSYVTYYAMFKLNDKVAIDLPAYCDYKGSITQNTGFDTTLNQKGTVNFYVGEKVYLKMRTGLAIGSDTQAFQSFTNSNGESFVYNCDSSNPSATTGFDCYMFEVQGTEKFTMNTVNSAYITSPGTAVNGEYYIVFKNGSKELAQNVTKSQSAAYFEPTSKPARYGKEFKGWAYEGDATETIVKIKTITESGVLVPVFAEKKNLKLTFKNGGRFALTADAETNEKTGFDFNTQVGITAPEKNANGKYFSGWYVNGILVSQKVTDYFTITESTTLEPKYEGNSELVIKTSYTISGKSAEVDGVDAAVFTGNWEVAKDVVKVVDTGFVYSGKGISGDGLTLDEVDGNYVRSRSSGLTGRNGSAVITLKRTSASAKQNAINAVFYIKYVDSNGKTVVKYSSNAAVK